MPRVNRVMGKRGWARAVPRLGGWAETEVSGRRRSLRTWTLSAAFGSSTKRRQHGGWDSQCEAHLGLHLHSWKRGSQRDTRPRSRQRDSLQPTGEQPKGPPVGGEMSSASKEGQPVTDVLRRGWTWGQHMKWNKPVTKRQTLYDPPYTWCLQRSNPASEWRELVARGLRRQDQGVVGWV